MWEFAGRDGAEDMRAVMELYNQKVSIPIIGRMPQGLRPWRRL